MRTLLWKHTWSLRLCTFRRPAGWRWSRPSGASPHRTGESPERRKREVIEYDKKKKKTNFWLHHRISLLASAVHSLTVQENWFSNNIPVDTLQWLRGAGGRYFGFDLRRKHKSCDVEGGRGCADRRLIWPTDWAATQLMQRRTTRLTSLPASMAFHPLIYEDNKRLFLLFPSKTFLSIIQTCV